MASKKQIEDAVFELEGFRVEIQLLSEKTALPAYDWKVMAPQRWKISEWKNERLEPYRMLVRGVTIYRGNGEPAVRDLQLGNLRDSYYEAEYGPIRKSPQ